MRRSAACLQASLASACRLRFGIQSLTSAAAGSLAACLHLQYQVSSEGQVYFASSIASPDKTIRERWLQFRAKLGGECEPPPRAFHSMNPGTFVAGKRSMILFGGLDRQGSALGDLWYFDVTDQTPGLSYSIVLNNMTALTPALERELASQISNGWGMADNAELGWRPQSLCGPCTVIHILSYANISETPGSTRIKFTATAEIFNNCIKPVLVTPGAFQKAVTGTQLKGVRLDPAYQVRHRHRRLLRWPPDYVAPRPVVQVGDTRRRLDFASSVCTRLRVSNPK